MENEGFKFDRELIGAMTTWFDSNKYMRESCMDSSRLFSWEGESLKMNLNMMTERYVNKFVINDMEKYCDGFMSNVAKVIAKVLADYALPTIVIKVEFVYWGRFRSRQVSVSPANPC